MTDSPKEKVQSALLLVLRPLARALLRCGFGFREFVELAKIAFVDVATSDYGLRGRPTNISRVAVMTGLTRKEVRRVRDLIEEGGPINDVRVTPIATILREWYTNERYLAEDGFPMVLPFDGTGLSFSSLVREHGGDIPAGAMRTELKRVGAVEEVEGGFLKAIKRAGSTAELDDRLVTYLSHSAYPLMLAISHSLEKEPASGETWPNYTAYSAKFVATDRVRIRELCRDKLDQFAKEIDDLFVAYEGLHDARGKSTDEQPAIGVSMFFYEDTDDRQASVWRAKT